VAKVMKEEEEEATSELDSETISQVDEISGDELQNEN